MKRPFIRTAFGQPCQLPLVSWATLPATVKLGLEGGHAVYLHRAEKVGGSFKKLCCY
jgi:hypothetical protein